MVVVNGLAYAWFKPMFAAPLSAYLGIYHTNAFRYRLNLSQVAELFQPQALERCNRAAYGDQVGFLSAASLKVNRVWLEPSAFMV